jgi:hypothetical protein
MRQDIRVGNISRNLLYRLTCLTQFAIIAMVLAIVIQSIGTHIYKLYILELAIWLSYIMSAVLLALLSYQFLRWFRANHNPLILLYMVTMVFFSLNGFFALAYITGELSNDPENIRPRVFGVYMLHVESGASVFRYLFISTSIISFILMWTSTVIMLRNYRRRYSAVIYWLVVAIPLLYFLSQFEPLLLDLLNEYRRTDPLNFSILYEIFINISRPMGGVLFGIAFFQVGRRTKHKQVSDYMIISATGVLLLLASNQVQLLVGAPFPPFGIVSVSFIGLSSFFVLVGIYASASSISQDSKLRSFIRKSVENEFRFLGSIGTAQMQDTIMDKVTQMTKKTWEGERLERAVQSSMSEEEIRQYVDRVLNEIHTKKQT